jgi:DNA-binding NarL/FixJ family response regulator
MSIRVVIVDDHPMFREGLRFTLERTDDLVVVGEAGDGRQALALARELDPDVIMMDLAMPILDGLTAITRLRAQGSRAAVLVLTMSEDDAGVFAAIRVGAQGYLVKGVAPDQVLSAVRALAAGNAVFGPHIAGRMLSFFAERRAGGAERFPDLSPREREVLILLAAGKSNQEIAKALVISPVTARNHVSSILAKLQVTNRREAMLLYHHHTDT